MNFKELSKQFAKFALVGALSFVIDYGFLMLFSQAFRIPVVISASLSFTISVVFNYFASMALVFERRDDLSRKREFSIFVILSVAGLIINGFIMSIGASIMGSGALSVTITKLIATAIVTFWNFFSRKYWLEAK